jgi:hypothetical protein
MGKTCTSYTCEKALLIYELIYEAVAESIATRVSQLTAVILVLLTNYCLQTEQSFVQTT